MALEMRANLADTLISKGQLIPYPLYEEFQGYTDSLSFLYAIMGASIKDETSVGRRTVLRAKLSGSMSQAKLAMAYADQFRKEKMEPHLDR